MLRRIYDPPAAGAGAADQNSTRMKMIVLFLYFAGTIVAIRLWMIIIRSNNILYETGGALATTLALYSLYWYLSRQFARWREEQRQDPSSSLSPETPEDIEARVLRERLEQAYGSRVHSFLLGGSGLTVATINALLQHSTLEKGCDHLCSPCLDVEKNVPPGSIAETEDCLECSVCLAGYEPGDAVTTLPCGHRYHRACITSWLLSRNLCPMCKQQPVQLGDLTAALELSAAETDLQDLSGMSDAHSQSPRPAEGTGGSSVTGGYGSVLSVLGRGIEQLLHAARGGSRRPSRRSSVMPLSSAPADTTISGTDHATTEVPNQGPILPPSQGPASEEGADLEAPPAGRAELAAFRPLSISDIRGIHSS